MNIYLRYLDWNCEAANNQIRYRQMENETVYLIIIRKKLAQVRNIIDAVVAFHIRHD